VVQAPPTDPDSSGAWVIAILAIAAVIPAQNAFADAQDPLNVVVGGRVTHDSNVFRVSNNPQSDVISSANVGLRLDKPYAQQRFQAEVTQNVTRYAEFSYLDFDGLDYRAAWLWHLSPRLSGTLSATHTESLIQFENTIGAQRDVRNADNRVFALDWSAFGGWHLLLGASQSKQASEVTVQPFPDFRSITGEGGIMYEVPSGSSVALIHRSTQGDYLDNTAGPSGPGANDYREVQNEVKAGLILNPNSTLTGRLAWLERTHDTATERDFSGLAGDLGYRWTPSPKLGFEWAASRKLSVYQDTNSNYVVDTSLIFTPSWKIREKVTLRMRLERVDSDFRGGTAPSAGPPRSDTTTAALLGADWLPVPSLAVGASLEYRQRSSNISTADYDATIASINASFQF
jgi:exopolysaccharide biosynthesis operon protein EpsL